MFVLGEILHSLAYLVNGISQILYWLLIARIIISWFPVDPYHGVVQFLHQTTEPLLAPFRRLPLQIGTLDLSPLIAFFALSLVSRLLVRILVTAAYQLGAQ